MASRGQLVVRFVGDIRDLSKATDRAGRKLSGVAKLGRGLGVGIGAVTAGVGILAVKTTKDLARVERLGKATANAIKATGGAAGRTKRQVDQQAESLERLTGAERETVTEGQNMLLTFKNIKGKQFDEATRAALDMGVAMNKGSLEGLDLQDTSIKLGKALNDPIKGISALSRVGVTFSEKQKAMIKRMVEMGNTVGAQKVILRELKSEFGGAAKAAGSSTEGMAKKIQNSFGNIAESVMSGVLPMLQMVMGWVTTKAMPALSRFGEWFKKDGLPALKKFGRFIADVVRVLVIVGSWIVKNRDWLGALGVTVGVVTGAIGIYKGAILLWTTATKAAAAAQIFLTGAFNKFKIAMATHPIGLVLLAITALVAGLVWFFTKTKTGQRIWKTFTEFLTKAMDNVVRFFKNAWKGIQNVISTVWRWIKKNWPLLLAIITGPIGLAVLFIIRNWKKISGALKSGWDWIKRNVFDRFVLGLRVWAAIFKLVTSKAIGFFRNLRDKLFSAGRWIRQNVFDRIGAGLTKLREWFRTAKDRIGAIWEGLKKAAAKPVNFLIKWVWNEGLRKMLNLIPGVNLGTVREVKFNRGGPVRGGVAGQDSVRAWLKPNEHVWTDKEVAAVGGHGVMKAMRNAALKGNLNGDPRFAGGGSLSIQDIVRGQRFARSQVGKPYGWGQVGPWSYDCSGFMSAITNTLNNAYPHNRRGSTASFPWLGFERGPGEFTIGSTPNYRGSGVGHMAGTLGGMNVESRGGHGVIVGSSALGATHGGFSQMAHLGRPGLSAMNDSSGGWFSIIKDVGRAIGRLRGQIDELMSGDSWIVSFLKKLAKGLWTNIATFINNKIPDWGFIPDNPIPTSFRHGGIARARPGGMLARVADGGFDEAVIPLGGPHAPRGGAPVYLTAVIEIGGKEIGKAIFDPIRHQVKVRGGVEAAFK
jgi:hypothetical protein